MKKARKKLLFVGVPILIIILFLVWLGARKPKTTYSTAPVTSGPLIQTVSETGTIKPIKEVSLNFLTAGKISAVSVKVGDQVIIGQALAALDDSSLILKKQETAASLEIARANLSKTQAGASAETINISRQSLAQAQSAMQSASQDLEKTQKTILENIRQAEKTYYDLTSTAPETQTATEQAVLSAETALANSKKTNQKTVDNARSSLLLVLNDKILTVKVALDSIYKILDDDNAENVLSVMDNTYKTKTEDGRLQVLALISNLESQVAIAKKSGAENDIISASYSLDDVLTKTAVVLDFAYTMLEKSVVSSSFTQTSLDAYKTSIISQNTAITTANSALESALQAYKNSLVNYDTTVSASESALSQAQVALQNVTLTAKNSLSNIKLASDQQNLAAKTKLENATKAVDLAQAQYNNTVAPARSQDLQLVEAQVSQAQAALASIEKQISDSHLVAPMAGVITEVNYEAGEQFGGGALPMIKMLVDNSFDVEVDIAEANISKLKLNNPVNITLDAFPDDLVLKGTVTFIEPAQTLISGVVYYKVKIEFSDLPGLMATMKERGLELKSGMTANAVITTDSRDNVLSIPSRAIVEKDNLKIVRLLVAEKVVEVPIETGLKGDDGLTEIKSGLKASDTVITFINAPATK
jgi:multidrug efflux pump subunit AcrA (membrane-fusion protein)